MKPIVKWAGGKRRMLDRLTPLVLERLSPDGVYAELFLGGAAVALEMPADVAVVAVDACEALVEAYRAVVDDPDLVHRCLERLALGHTRESYYAVRARETPDRHGAAARFLYLNKACFNGLYRVGPRGFNVPVGKSRRIAWQTRDELVEFSRVAGRWALACGSNFQAALEQARRGDVVFADPPYDGTFDYSTRFGPADQAALADALRRAGRRGVGVVATNADTPLVRDLYGWARVESLSEARFVGATTRQPAPCVLAVYP